MNKADLIANVAERSGESKAATERVINALQETVIEAVAAGQPVKLTGFFAVEPVERAARTMRNPQTGAEIKVAETRVPRFRALKQFKDSVAK